MRITRVPKRALPNARAVAAHPEEPQMDAKGSGTRPGRASDDFGAASKRETTLAPDSAGNPTAPFIGASDAISATQPLKTQIDYAPTALKFGTSGRRFKVKDVPQLEIYAGALGELKYLLSIPVEQGGIRPGDPVYFAYDLRPSSTELVKDLGDRGELAQVIERAIADAGLIPVNCGDVPTPAVASYARQRGKACVMITGSHIPFDMNGWKTYGSRGELRKDQEATVTAAVEHERARLYDQPLAESPFDRRGQLKSGHAELQPPDRAAARAFVQRYLDFFGPQALGGTKVLCWQHSAVGRDLLPEVLGRLGADVRVDGRSSDFVAVDTENVGASTLSRIQEMLDRAHREHGFLPDAIVSTDGDSDRPFVCVVAKDSAGAPRAEFVGGDSLGMVAAQYFDPDAVVVPVTCNDSIDRGPLRDRLQRKTRVGSPNIIDGMEAATAQGRQRVCGFEANGGFLTGSDIVVGGRTLPALPTRDAFLPTFAFLRLAKERGVPPAQLVANLPRSSGAVALSEFPREKARSIVKQVTPKDPSTVEVRFDSSSGGVSGFGAQGERLGISSAQEKELNGIRALLTPFFPKSRGFGDIVAINYVDAPRIFFSNGDIVHIRPSGNADDFRAYAVADSFTRKSELLAMAAAPDGILRTMERELAGSNTVPGPA